MLWPLVVTRLRPYRWSVLTVVVLLLLQAAANLYLPTVNADLINRGVVPGNLAVIRSLGANMLIVALLQGVVSIAGIWFSSRAAMAVGRDLRAEVFTSVQAFSEAEFARFGSATLITRNTNDVQQLVILIQVALTVMILAPIQAVGGVLMAMHEDLRLSTLLLVAVPALAGVIALIMRRAIPRFRTLQVRIDDVNRVLREQITGIRVVRAFTREPHEVARFAKVNNALTDNALSVNRIFTIAMPSMMLILNISSVAVIWFGGHLVASGGMQIGTLAAFLSYIMQILTSVLMAVMVLVLVPRAGASAERVSEVLTAKASVPDPAEPVTTRPDPGAIKLRNVSFAYPGAQDAVLKEIDLYIQPGRTTAIVGSTGSGKSTLLQLITRQFDATSGEVLVDGVNVMDQVRADLWGRLGVVLQRPYLFSGTIADNVRFGATDKSDSDVAWALALAQADFALDPSGPVAQGGSNLSGGQKQRLAIARAVVRRPAILLLDDSFAALDAATDSRLRLALGRELDGTTIVVVAQRISSILMADHIVVLDDGRIVAQGTHEELLASSQVYGEIVTSQRGPDS